MVKRVREDDDVSHDFRSKRSKPLYTDHLSRLPDEVKLRVFSFLTVSDLLRCEEISREYRSLARDGSLWKAHYYRDSTRPRRKQTAGMRDIGFNQILKGTTWKWRYKLRHNWNKGSCTMKEVHVAAESSIPPMLVQLHEGTIYMVDRTQGLRAWSVKSHSLVAHLPISREATPTSLAVCITAQQSSTSIVVVGHENGTFAVYSLQKDSSTFTHCYSHNDGSNDAVVTAIALSWPYVVTLTATQKLSLWKFGSRRGDSTHSKTASHTYAPPAALHTLTSRSIWPPLSTSIRESKSSITVSLGFALPTYLSGWTVGIQEIVVDLEGKLLDSRIASAIEEHFRPLTFASRPMFPHIASFQPSFPGITSARELRHIHSKPISLSYTHPYLLVSHPDNTLAVYLVTSTAESLSVSPGSRLWGHTSSVSGAHIGGRGRAVSISRRGDELRVWELEGGLTSMVAKKRLTDRGLGIKVRPGQKAHIDHTSTPKISASGDDTDRSSQQPLSELSVTRGWIGFDDENVVFLREDGQGKQVLVICNFS